MEHTYTNADGSVLVWEDTINKSPVPLSINGRKVFTLYGRAATSCLNGTLSVKVEAKSGIAHKFDVVYVKTGQQFTLAPVAE